MKIRTGFISNSSSSSFLIYGVYLDTAEMVKYLGTKHSEEEDGCPEDDFYEELDKTDLQYWGPCDSWDGYFIGESLTECKDDQTMGDFKKQVKEQINSKMKEKIPDSKFDFHEEEYYS